MDTIINVCRDGRVVDIDVEFPTANGKALLNSDNPYRLIESSDTSDISDAVEDLMPA